MQGRRGVLGLVVAVSLVAVLLAPAGGVRGQGSNVLNVGQQDQMKTLNILMPLAWEDPHTMAVLARVYDTAVQRDPTTGAVVPRLARGIDANGNGRFDSNEAGRFIVPASARDITVFYNFTPASLFHDGLAVSIMDVLFSYHVLAMQPITSAGIRVLMGANYSTTHWLSVVPVDDGDNNPATAALRFTLQFAYANFPWATLGIPILPRHVWEGTGFPAGHHADFGIAIYPEPDPRAGQGVSPSETVYTPFDLAAARAWQLTDVDVVGSGHFRFVTWQFGSYSRLDANAGYEFGRPQIDEIIFKVYRTTQLGVLALMSGDIDLFLCNLPSEFLPELQNYSQIAIMTAADFLPITIEFNMRRVPFGYSTYPPPAGQDRDPPAGVDLGHAFREAFAHLIDAPTIVRSLLQNTGVIADGMVNPADAVWHNASLPLYTYSPATAAAILDAAGFTVDPVTGWRTLPRLGTSQFYILTPQADYDPIRASIGAMISAAARSIDVNVASTPSSFGAILQDLTMLPNPDFDAVLLGGPDQHAYDPWTLSRGDPDSLLDLLHSSNGAAGRNHAGFHDAQFDNVSESARAAPDFTSRQAAVMYEQGILADRLPVIPTVYRNISYAYRIDHFDGWLRVGTTVFNYWTLQGLHARPVPSPPTITLASPPNGANIPRGTVIDLEITDSDVFTANYSLDGGANTTLPAPYDISTASWSIGEHTLLVAAQDANASATTRTYTFTVYELPPLTDLGQVMTLVLAIVLIAVVAVVLAALLLYRRWKRESRGSTGPPPGPR